MCITSSSNINQHGDYRQTEYVASIEVTPCLLANSKVPCSNIEINKSIMLCLSAKFIYVYNLFVIMLLRSVFFSVTSLPLVSQLNLLWRISRIDYLNKGLRNFAYFFKLSS
jgi:hypothetical protein